TPIISAGASAPSLAVTSFRDITAEKEAKLAIQRSQTTLTKILNGVPAMISHWDQNMLNIHANNALADFFGMRAEEIRGKTLRSLLGEELFQKNYPYVKKVLAGEAQSFERTIKTPDGSFRFTVTNYLPDIENGEVVGFFVIVNEITEIKRLELERQEFAAKMLESAKLSSLGEMAGGVAHEINTPLAIISAKASMLLEKHIAGKVTHEEATTQLQKIVFTTERITKIIKGLRMFSRNSENDSAEPISIVGAINSTLDLCNEKLVQSQIKLFKEWSDDPLVLGKFTELSQVMMNLLSNSMDAIEGLSEKWIRIQVTQNSKVCRIIVTDSGTGIPDQIAEKIMQPFFTTKEIGKGTGLGLSISNGIIKSHGGKFWYDSSSPNTCFVLELPAAAAPKGVGAA
ncbi:MAG: PAS domain S-box protein, partial [Bdellovibrionales bacterium]|nr:PAS domain S-box protein [Bdellovibrionales bacterium]